MAYNWYIQYTTTSREEEKDGLPTLRSRQYNQAFQLYIRSTTIYKYQRVNTSLENAVQGIYLQILD